MSFFLTTQQIRDRTKDVTRRDGWWNLKEGDLFWAVVKGMGLKKGEKVERIALLRVVSTRPERLDEMTKLPAYGIAECEREGFPNLTPKGFVKMFCASHPNMKPSSMINRIEFDYV